MASARPSPEAGTPAATGEAPGEIPPEILASHADLSPAAARWLALAQADPELARRVEVPPAGPLAELLRRLPHCLQSWPVLVDARKLRQLERATVGLVELVKQIPERLLGGEPRRLREWYGLRDERVAERLLAPPSGIATSLARADLIDDGVDFKCLEVNVSGSLGGWELRFFDAACRSQPGVAAFLAAEGLAPRYRDPWRGALAWVLACGGPGWRDEAGRCNVAVALGRQVTGWEGLVAAMNGLFQEVLRDAGAAAACSGGRIVGCTYPNDLLARGGALYHRNLRIGAVIELTTMPTPRDVYRCFKEGSVGLFNGPISALLSSKRNLALLSQHEDSDCLTAAERELVRRHVPWSRLVADERTTWRGERVDLLEFAAARRESLVLKPVAGYQGIGVHAGSVTPPDRWRQHLVEAAGTGKVLLQEYVPSRPYLFQAGEQGWAPHRAIWGTFSFGGSYGGGFVRALPLGLGPGAVNLSQGASEGLIYEV